MMTWHTRFSFGRSATDLENEHLRAQIDDAADLIDMVLAGGRPSEPCYYMWKHHLDALLVMGMLFSMEWTFNRGYDDKTFWKFSRLADERRSKGEFLYSPPPWFRDEDVVLSHRSALISRFPETYAEMWPSAPKKMPILWPVVTEGGAVAELRVAKADLPLVGKTLKIPSNIKSRVVNL